MSYTGSDTGALRRVVFPSVRPDVNGGAVVDITRTENPLDADDPSAGNGMSVEDARVFEACVMAIAGNSNQGWTREEDIVGVAAALARAVQARKERPL